MFETTESVNRARRESRNRMWGEQKALVDRASAEKRNLTVAEADEYDRRERELVQIDRAIKSGESYAAGNTDERILTPDDEKRARAFDSYMRTGVMDLRTTYDTGLQESGFQASGTNGGYMVPQGFWDQLIALKAYGGLAPYVRLVTTATGNPMDWPTVDPTGVVGHIVGEGVVDTFQDYTFGQGVLNAWTYTSKVILASLELVNDSAFDIGSLVADRVGEAIGRALGASVSGSGSGQPLGLMTALAATSDMSSGGVVTLASATSVNLVGGGTTTELEGNVLGPVSVAAMQRSINSAYWNSPEFAWYMNPDQFVNMQNVADGYGRPLWPSLQQTSPSLVSFPVRVVAEIPDLAASTVGGIVLADLNKAMVRREVAQAELLCLRERYADARQIGYFGFIRTDIRSNDLRAAAVCEPAST